MPPRAAGLALLILAALLSACGPSDRADTSTPGAGDDVVDVTGAGATFPYPVYARWISRFAGETGLRINYRSVGTGQGLAEVAAGSVDFGASDAPLDAVEADSALIQLPLVVGGVVVTYNVPQVTAALRLDGPLLAEIFAGRVARWDDARIRALNPDVALPNLSIKVITRLDPSGTTIVFTRFLAANSPAWRESPGVGLSVPFPAGMTRAGNESVASEVKVTIGAIGYVEQSYATLNRLPMAQVRNASGNFVAASASSLIAAANSAAGSARPDGLPASLLGATAADAYPIAEFSWIVLPQVASAPAARRTLLQFVRWALASGSAEAAALGYAPVPTAVRQRVETLVDSLAALDRTP